MLNHAVYKSCLFLSAGNVEYRTKTTELDELGGLAKAMPITYFSCLIASLSISGVPPFNGFVSKWMIYQGLISQFQGAGLGLRIVSIISLIAAMFGSGLTLASFMKLIHATFLGQTKNSTNSKQLKNEVPWTMWLPCLILAFICIVFGVFAYQLPLKYFILPAAGGVVFTGTWLAGLSSLLIFVGLVLGIIIFKSKGLGPALRQDASFTGAETKDLKEGAAISGVEFYNTIKEFSILKFIYKKAEEHCFDIYEQGKNLVFGLGRFFQLLHNGVLPTYLVWCLLGMVGLFLILLR